MFLGRAEFLVWVEGAKEGLQKELDDIDRFRRDGISSKYDAKKEIKLREIGYHLDMALSNPQWTGKLLHHGTAFTSDEKSTRQRRSSLRIFPSWFSTHLDTSTIFGLLGTLQDKIFMNQKVISRC